MATIPGPALELKFYHGADIKADGIVLDDPVTVGRQPGNTVVLIHKTVSRHHATFLVDRESTPPTILLRDEKSTNGCVVNGKALNGQTIQVQRGDAIQIGVFRVEMVEAQNAFEATQDLVYEEDASVTFETSPSRQATLPDIRLRALYELSARTAVLHGEDLLKAALAVITNCLPVDVLYAAIDGEGYPRISLARNATGACPPGQIALSHSILKRCRQEGIAVLVDDKHRDSKRSDEDSKVSAALKSALCVPLTGVESTFGVIYASSPRDVAYTREDLQLLILIGSLVANKLAAAREFRVVHAEKEKLETILSSLQEGVLLLDGKLRVVATNAAARDILGLNTLSGVLFADALKGFQHDLVVESLPSIHNFQLRKPAGPNTPLGVSSSGEKVYTATVSRSPKVFGNNGLLAICLHDVSEQHELERMKSLFLNRLGHKICTPLTVVMATSSLVGQYLEGNKDPELRQLLESNQEHVEQCASLVRRFIEYAGLSLTDAAVLKRERCLLGDLVDAAVSSNQRIIEDKLFNIVKAFCSDTTEVDVDREKLTLALHHLIQNAVKFGKSGGSLLIGAVPKAQKLQISFLDDGPGIPARELKNCGQIFYQVDPGNTGEVPGAGFGLWLVRQIVQCHSGTLELSSPACEGGEGTRVDITLPGRCAELSEEDATLHFAQSSRT